MNTLKYVDDKLKLVYLNSISDLLNKRSNHLLEKIEKTTQYVYGKDITMSEKEPNSRFVSSLKNIYSQIEISDRAIQAFESNRSRFDELFNSELSRALEISKFNSSRMLFGDGTGFLANVISANPSEKRIFTVDDTRNLAEGLTVDIYDSKDVKINSNLKISEIRNNEIIFGLVPDSKIPDGSKIYSQWSKNRELTGISSIFSNSDTLYGLKRKDNPLLNPYNKKIENGCALSESLITETIKTIEGQGKSKINYIACSREAKLSYMGDVEKNSKHIDIMAMPDGSKCLSFNGIPFVYDRFIEAGSIYFLDTNAFKIHQLSDWRFLEDEAGRILKESIGKLSYTAILVKYCDLICHNPQGQGKISGIKID